MSPKKTLLLAGLIALCTLLGSGFGAYANENPPPTGAAEGPELWAVVVLDCGAQNVATMRVKRIVNCNVEVQAVSQGFTQCPSDANDVLYWTFDTLTLFDINPDPAVKYPIIMGVKNYQAEPGGIDVYSFDAKLMFWAP
jgi:hypothetical protein